MRFGSLIVAAAATLLVNASAPPARAGLDGDQHGRSIFLDSRVWPNDDLPSAGDLHDDPSCENLRRYDELRRRPFQPISPWARLASRRFRSATPKS